MNKLLAAIVICLAFTSAQANSLRVVEVSAPSINCLFDPTCRVVVNDSTDSIPLPTSGTNFLQSRTYRGQPGSAADGLYVYQYRLDLRRAEGILHIPCLSSLTINFGRVVNTLDFDGDGNANDQVFVVTRGGLGTVGLASAEQQGNRITFNFSVCAGGRPGSGQSTFFFGLVSTRPPQRTTATIVESTGDEYAAQARAPKKVVSEADRLVPRDESIGSITGHGTAFNTGRAVIDQLGPGPCVDRGGTVSIYGSGFGSQQRTRLVELGSHGIGVLLRVTSWSDAMITAIVPDDRRINYGQWYYIGLQNRDRRWISNISRTINICRQLE